MEKQSSVVLHILPLLFFIVHTLVCMDLVQCQGEELLDYDAFPYSYALDDNYRLRWNFNDSHIVFETRVKTNGYIGFGISATYGMYPSDVIIGWIDDTDGRAYFSDRHASNLSMPVVDARQDWFLLNASEVGEYTTLTFVRRLDTCDPQDDMPIEDNRVHVIYSYHPDDPVAEDDVIYHGAERRGSRDLSLRNPSVQNHTLPDDVIHVDFFRDNFSLPAVSSYYVCSVYKLPADVVGKHHMIKWEPIIQEGNERVVHHFGLYACPADTVDEAWVGREYACRTEEEPEELLKNCYLPFIGWTQAEQAFYYPDHVGVPLGSAGDPVYFKFETHYENPSLRSDVIDTSGLRLSLTKQLRQHDAGFLLVDSIIRPYPLIPPGQSLFRVQAFCRHECLSEGIDSVKSIGSSNGDGDGDGDGAEIHVYAVKHHAHLLARKVRTRLVRDGAELAPIYVDNHYDFEFQENVVLREERSIRSGDDLIVECDYDSSHRENYTIGGPKSTDEMCNSFLMYYPRMTLNGCKSKPYIENFTASLFDSNESILSWDLDQYLDSDSILTECQGHDKNFRFRADGQVTPKVDVSVPYVPPPTACSGGND